MERAGSAAKLKIAAILGAERTATPKVEHMFAAKHGRLGVDAKGNKQLEIHLLHAEGDAAPQVSTEAVVVVAQLRAPYAERISSLVGAHTSRIGVDFVNFG